jgi:hypothetical protein
MSVILPFGKDAHQVAVGERRVDALVGALQHRGSSLRRRDRNGLGLPEEPVRSAGS